MVKEITGLLSTYFGEGNYEQLEGDGMVFKCQSKFNSEVYQQVYVDITGKWQSEDFNVETHLENYLLNDYYEETGFLQWNYYYYFIQPDDLSINPIRKSAIEENMTYARKFVLSVKSFGEWLKLISQIGNISEIGMEADLSTIWIDFLRGKKLIPVFNKNYYFNEGVEVILQGTVQADVDDTDADLSSAAFEGIERLQNHNFTSNRKYPLIKEYNFKTVNLITGSNATGKTSLLTSLEILLTGKSYKGNTNDNFKITTTYNGGKLHYPAPAKIYKQRDKSWYSSGRSKGEVLNENFGRYNYYSSDAAYDLEYHGKNGEPELLVTLQNIALGKEVNELETRINKFKSDLDGSRNNLENGIKVSQGTYDKNLQELAAIRDSIKKPNEYLDVILKLFQEIGYTKTDGFILSTQSLIGLDSQFTRGRNIVTQIKELAFPSYSDFKSISSELAKLDKIEQQISDLDNKISNSKKELDQLKNSRTELNTSNTLFKRFFEYRNLKYFDSIQGLLEKINSQKDQLKKIEQINQISLLIRWNTLTFDFNEDVENIRTKLTNNSFELQRQIKEQEGKIEQLQTGIRLLDKLVSDIKSSGLNYVSNNPDATECPLCLAEYPVGDLYKRIEQSKSAFEDSTVLEGLKTDLLKFQDRLEQNTISLKSLEPIIELKHLFVSMSSEKPSILQLQRFKQLNQEQLLQLQTSLKQSEAYQNELVENKMSESELSLLSEKLFLFLKDQKSNLEIENEIRSIKEKISAAEEKIQKAGVLTDEFLKERSNLLLEHSIDSTILSAQKALLKKLKTLYEEISQILKVDDTDSIEIIEQRLEKAISEVLHCKAQMENEKASTIAEKSFEESNKELLIEINEKKRLLQNAIEACDNLAFLVTNHGKNKYLETFMKKNKEELINTFLLIHSPKEFSGLEIEPNSIKFIRKDSAEKASLSEISTGQRTALAVSIFLLLNKKLKNGPNVLLFDEPIAFVDDLNILSFLDYLREIVIQANRQMFFCTANNDLAFLFKKKFEFLSEEFEFIKLERDLSIAGVDDSN